MMGDNESVYGAFTGVRVAALYVSETGLLSR